MNNKKIAFLGIMGALALVLGFAENMLIPDIPFLPVGAKPGLSNVVTMYVALMGGFPWAIYITLLKAGFALITRGAVAGLMSLCGGVLSTAVICILVKKRDKLFSFVGIGVAGALMHNLGQLIAACLISGTAALFSYGKILMIFSLITGILTGTVLLVLIPATERINNSFKRIKNDKEMEL